MAHRNNLEIQSHSKRKRGKEHEEGSRNNFEGKKSGKKSEEKRFGYNLISDAIFMPGIPLLT